MPCQHCTSCLESCYHLLFIEEDLWVPRESPWTFLVFLEGNIAVAGVFFMKGLGPALDIFFSSHENVLCSWKHVAVRGPRAGCHWSTFVTASHEPRFPPLICSLGPSPVGTQERSGAVGWLGAADFFFQSKDLNASPKYTYIQKHRGKGYFSLHGGLQHPPPRHGPTEERNTNLTSLCLFSLDRLQGWCWYPECRYLNEAVSNLGLYTQPKYPHHSQT